MLLSKTSHETCIKKCIKYQIIIKNDGENKWYINNRMSGILLEGEALSRCDEGISAITNNEASFESSFDNLQQFEKEQQAGRAERQGAGDLLSDGKKRIGGL
jgi:hypothetical protein